MKQLRIYTIQGKDFAEQYFNVHWVRHLPSLKKHGIQVHSVTMESQPQSDLVRVFALVSSEGDNLLELNQQYMQSEEFIADMQGFDMTKILSVEQILVEELPL